MCFLSKYLRYGQPPRLVVFALASGIGEGGRGWRRLWDQSLSIHVAHREAATVDGGMKRTGKVTHFGPCSAKTGEGVKELFETAVKLTYCSATSSSMTSDAIAISRVTDSYVERARN